MSTQHHPYHLVDASPWPMTGSIGAFGLTTGFVMWFNNYVGGVIIMLLGIALICSTMGVWWRDVIRESSYLGKHTRSVETGIKYAAVLFLTSEIALFFSLFWAFFHASLAPTIEIGAVWPPVGIAPLDAFQVPLLNTAILLTSGATVTWAHHGLVHGSRKDAINGLALTIVLGVIFTALQGLEYYEAPFTMADSVYGASFYLATGFHGFHVIIGTTFLLVCLVRLINWQLTQQHHIGFLFSCWYWHMVDVVWLFLFVSIYWWGA